MTGPPHCVYITFRLLNHSSIVGHLGYFHILAIVNNATMNLGVQISLLICNTYGHHCLLNLIPHCSGLVDKVKLLRLIYGESSFLRVALRKMSMSSMGRIDSLSAFA